MLLSPRRTVRSPVVTKRQLVFFAFSLKTRSVRAKARSRFPGIGKEFRVASGNPVLGEQWALRDFKATLASSALKELAAQSAFKAPLGQAALRAQSVLKDPLERVAQLALQGVWVRPV